MSGLRQFPLPFAHEPSYAPADFMVAACNEAAMAWLRRAEAGPQRRLALSGPAGSGKSHMLRIWAARVGASCLVGHTLRFVPVGGALAIDDADLAPERALLHMLNAAAEAGWPVLLSGRGAPARWGTALPDLASRLRAITHVPIETPDDEMLRALFARLLADRQLAVAEPVQDWLRLRLPRTAGVLREAAARLDRLAYSAGRPASRVLAARVLTDMMSAELIPGDGDVETSEEASKPGAARTRQGPSPWTLDVKGV
jgi:chromosomal replication initiation ATPase DnaA